MGACGCGDTHIHLRFPAPGGATYGVQFYGGCRDCDIGPGVILHRFDPNVESGEDGFLRCAVELKFPFEGSGYAMRMLPVIDSEAYRRSLEAATRAAWDAQELEDIDHHELADDAMKAGMDAAFEKGWK